MNKWCPGHSSRFDFLIYSHFSKTETFFSPVMFKMSCSHKIWGQCLSYGCYRVGPTLKIRVLLSHSGMRTLQDLQAGKYWSCHPMQTAANSWAVSFPTDTELKCFQIVLFLHYFTWQTKRFTDDLREDSGHQRHAWNQTQTQISSKGAMTVFRESINETPAHKGYLRLSTASYFPLLIYSVISHAHW